MSHHIVENAFKLAMIVRSAKELNRKWAALLAPMAGPSTRVKEYEEEEVTKALEEEDRESLASFFADLSSDGVRSGR